MPSSSISSPSSIRAAKLSCIPAFTMLLLTLLGLGHEPRPSIAGALQHFAAGVLLCAIGTELLPEMIDATGFAENSISIVGFILGMGLLLLLGVIMGDEEQEEEEEDGKENFLDNTDDKYTTTTTTTPNGHEKQQENHQNHHLQQKYNNDDTITTLILPSPSSTPDILRLPHDKPLTLSRPLSKGRCGIYRITSMRKTALSSSSQDARCFIADNNEENTPLLLLHPHSSVKQQQRRQRQTHPISSSSYPIQLLVAIVVDSLIDGLLIGIATAAGPSAAPMMAGSLAIEMGFLGLTLSTALHHHHHQQQPTQRRRRLRRLLPTVGAAMVGPMAIVIGAILGGFMAVQMAKSRVFYHGLMGFGTSALLFMVAEELLLEAHMRDGGGGGDKNHVWWVDLQLYVGFLASILGKKMLELKSVG